MVGKETTNPAPLKIPRMRGGPLHNYLVARAGDVFSADGFEVRMECPLHLDDGRIDFVDLLASRGGCVVACEVETTARHVLINIDKARALALPLLIIVPNRKVYRAVVGKVRSASPAGGKAAIIFLTLCELPQALRNCFPLFSQANVRRKNGKIKGTAPENASQEVPFTLVQQLIKEEGL